MFFLLTLFSNIFRNGVSLYLVGTSMFLCPVVLKRNNKHSNTDGEGRTSNKQIFKEDTLSYFNLEHSFHSINKTSDVNMYLLVILSP